MANNKKPAVSLQDMLKESREKKKAEELAQEIFGRRSRTPASASIRAKPVPGASLASRVGVNKHASRTASLPRSNTAPVRTTRPPPQARPPPQHRPSAQENYRTRPARTEYNEPAPALASDVNSNGHAVYDEVSSNGNGGSFTIRGAAGPYIVVAHNFASGTTAADIQSVMQDVGGQCTCKIVKLRPEVTAEMTFEEREGAERVIGTFNGKKADGRVLQVYWQNVEQEPAVVDTPVEPAEDTMEVDENAESREAQDRLREERRGVTDRRPRDEFPTGPRDGRGYDDDYYRRPRAEPAYQDNRYGFGPGRDRYDNRGGYRDDGRARMYSRGGGQTWRP